jgi:hypothetical protein
MVRAVTGRALPAAFLPARPMLPNPVESSSAGLSIRRPVARSQGERVVGRCSVAPPPGRPEVVT